MPPNIFKRIKSKITGLQFPQAPTRQQAQLQRSGQQAAGLSRPPSAIPTQTSALQKAINATPVGGQSLPVIGPQRPSTPITQPQTNMNTSIGNTLGDVFGVTGTKFKDININKENIPTQTPTSPQTPTVPPSTPTPAPTFTPQPIDPQLADLRSQFAGTFTPSTREQQLSSQIAGRLGGFEIQQAGLEGQGRGITLPFITGQQAALKRQASAELAPLQRQLAILQGQRKNKQAGLEQQLGFKQADTAQQNKQKQAFNKNTRQEAILGLIGQGITDLSQLSKALPGVPFNEIADVIKTRQGLQPKEQKLDTQVINRGGRNILIDKQTGNTIADLGISGNKGGANSIDPNFLSSLIESPGLFNQLTPSVKSKLLPSLTAAGFKPVRPLPEKVVSGFSAFDNISSLTDRLNVLLKQGVSTGPLSSAAGVLQRITGTENQNQLAFENISQQLLKTIIKAASGVAASDNEVVRLQKFVPLFSKQEKTNLNDIKQFKQTVNDTLFNALNRLNASGFDVSGQLNIFDNRLLSETPKQIIQQARQQLKPNENLVINRKTGNLEAITADEFDKIKHLII